MLELAVVAARLAQFLGAVVLCGSPLFFLYALREDAPMEPVLHWRRPLLLGAALLLTCGATAALIAQTATMTGSAALAIDPESLWAVLSGTQFGRALGVRLALALLTLILVLTLKPTRAAWVTISGVGLLILASFAWTGHGAAEAGAAGLVHAASDVVHLVAAGVWLGALAALALLLITAHRHEEALILPPLHRALEDFSGIGSTIVALLIATGLVNSWFLVGPSHLADLFRTTYGWLLLIKILAFGAMLMLAAANRFLLTPRLGGALTQGAPSLAAVRALRRSILIESGLGIAVLVLVSVLGMLAPLSARV